MTNETIAHGPFLHEGAVVDRYLETSDEQSFADLFNTFTPQLVAFFRVRGGASDAEDLAQEVMLSVYRKSHQVRNRSSFRAWIFKIARNALSRYYAKQARNMETADLADIPDRLTAQTNQNGATAAFELLEWMAFLDVGQKEALMLRFIEQWEYHEIAAAQCIPIGTVQSRVFNARKKLARLLEGAKRTPKALMRRAA